MTSSNIPPPRDDEFGAPTIVEPLTAQPRPTYVDPAPSVGSDAGNTTDSTADVAKSQAADVAQSAGAAGQQVVGVAKEQTHEVTAEAGRQARDLFRQTQSELADQAGTQQHRLADGLHALGQELASMADKSEQPGTATSLVRQAADRSHQASSWLRDREPGAVLDEVRDFARRRPGAFLAVAVGAGLLAGRLTRGIKDDSGPNTESTSSDRDITSASPVPDSGTLLGSDVSAPGYPLGGTDRPSPLAGPLADEPASLPSDGWTDSRP
jgi:hypothetical protein